MKGRTIPILATMVLLVLPAVANAAFGPWDGSPGPFEVHRIDSITLHDVSRDKFVVASIQIPDGEGPFPLIVFSHGYGGSKDAYRLITSYWATHGYVVIQPSHADAGGLQTIRDLLQVLNIWKNERPPEWRERVADLVLMMDSLDEIEERVPELRGKIDRSRIGLGGHSYGGMITELIAGTKSYVENPPLDFREPRVKAAISMSPEGTSEDLGFTTESWSGITIPMMFMTGSLDRAAGGHPAEWRREAYTYSPPGEKYLVFIEGARHLSFSGRVLEPDWSGRRRRAVRRSGDGVFGIDLERERQIFSWIESASLAFWDATLNDSVAAKVFLASDLLTRRSNGAVELDRK